MKPPKPLETLSLPFTQGVCRWLAVWARLARVKRLRHLALPLAMVVSFATGACDDEDKTDETSPSASASAEAAKKKEAAQDAGPCRPGDLSGCTTLCEAGDAVSCQRLAEIYGTSSEVSEEGRQELVG